MISLQPHANPACDNCYYTLKKSENRRFFNNFSIRYVSAIIGNSRKNAPAREKLRCEDVPDRSPANKLPPARASFVLVQETLVGL